MSEVIHNTGHPHSAVVYIEVTYPDGTQASGSGAVVGRNDVLTASHVIWAAEHGGLATSITVTPARDGAAKPFGSFEAKHVSYLPVDQDGDGLLYSWESANDIAVLGFDTAIGARTGQFQLDYDGASGVYNKTGYPSLYSGFSGPRMVEDSAYMFKSWSSDAWFTEGFEINSGDSGGPLWQREGDVAKVVGVVSTGGYAPDVGEHEARLTTWLAQNDSLLGDAPVRPVELGEIIHGGAGADLLTGGGGDDTLHADSGADTLSGGAGDDLIYGNLETDLINGGAGADVLYGGQNNGPATTRNGGSARREGIETVSGGDGADLVYGNMGGDHLYGDAGDDRLYGGQDDDLLLGGSGADRLDGNRNDDVLSGGAGRDTLIGGAGDDTLYGGLGLDQFHFADGSGQDVIVDRPRFGERLYIARDINGTGVTTTADLLARLSDNAAGQAVLDLGGGHSVTFLNYNSSWFITSDFVIF